LSGARVGGLLGVVIAVPAAVVFKEALDALRRARQEAAGIVLVTQASSPKALDPEA
jgi:predicted PurR-regulated permease PerM